MFKAMALVFRDPKNCFQELGLFKTVTQETGNQEWFPIYGLLGGLGIVGEGLVTAALTFAPDPSGFGLESSLMPLA